jgi:hypothetical protein
LTKPRNNQIFASMTDDKDLFADEQDNSQQNPVSSTSSDSVSEEATNPQVNEAVTLEDRIEVKVLEDEMQRNYLTYAMSVIVSRALPDVRDGLKPVHRRILYTMHKMGLTPGAKYVKSARVGGRSIG